MMQQQGAAGMMGGPMGGGMGQMGGPGMAGMGQMGMGMSGPGQGMGMFPNSDMNAQAGMSGMMGGPNTPSFDQRQMNGQMPQTQMMPGGMEQDQLAQQIRETERQMAEMQEQIQKAQMGQMNFQGQGSMMPNTMASPGFGGNMGAGDQWEDESDSGSENDWWNQPVSYGQGGQGQGMPGSYNSAGMQGMGGNFNGAGMQQPGGMDPYSTQ